MAACELDEDTKAKVLRQVEFYFSDSNLPGDNFLVTTIQENEDGLISLALVCSFSRMRGHLGLKEHGADRVPAEITAAVAEVLRGSTFLKISEDGSKVGRLNPLESPEAARVEVDSRSIAANPLPFDIKLDDVEAFFKKHATVRSVRLPRIPGVGAFSGYATVELESVEEAQRVLTLKLELHGVSLELETKKAFDERQAAFSAQNGHKIGQMRRNNFGGRSGEDQDHFPKNRVISFTVRKCSEKAAPSAESSKIESTPEKVEKEDDPASTEQAVESTDGTEADGAAKMEVELSIEAQVAREDIKGALEKYGKVVFIDYSRGEESGFARFDEEEATQQARVGAVMAAEGGLLVKGHILTLEAVEGEAEKDYWKKVREAQGRVREGGGRGYGDRGRDGGGRGYGDRGRDGGGRGYGDRGRGRGRGRGGRGRGRSRDGGGDEKNNGVAKGKHMRFDDDEETQEKKLARTE